MINLSTPSEELWETLEREYGKAKYWMIKHFGGEESYERMRDDLLRRSTYGECDLASDIVDYTSKDGNRWICFEYSRYYPESLGSHCLPLAFCYYETACSLGVFMLGFRQAIIGDRINSALIFTPHFFQRYCERAGFTGTQRELLLHFAKLAPSFTAEYLPKDEDGIERAIIRIGGYNGYGLKRPGDKAVFEVRTILNDGQLSHKQSRESEHVREMDEKLKFEPTDMQARRVMLKNNGLQGWMDEIARFEKAGLDTTAQRNFMQVNYMMSATFIKMGIHIPEEESDQRTRDMIGKQMSFFINRMEEESDKFHFFREYVALAKSIARMIDVKKFDWRRFIKLTLVDHYEYSERDAELSLNTYFPK